MSYIGAATAAVGGEMQGWAAVEAKKAMTKAFQDELFRQQAYRGEGTMAFERGLPGMGREQADADLAAGRVSRMADYSRNTRVPLGFATPNAPTSGQDKAYGNIIGQRTAALGAYSDWGLQQMIRNIRLQQGLDKISNFAAGTASVYPYEAYKAQHSWDALAQAGAAIAAIGSAAGGGGGGGGGGPTPATGPPIGGSHFTSGPPAQYSNFYPIFSSGGSGVMNPYAFY